MGARVSNEVLSIAGANPTVQYSVVSTRILEKERAGLGRLASRRSHRDALAAPLQATPR